MKSIICLLLACLMLVSLPLSGHAAAGPETGDQANSWRYQNGVFTGGNIPAVCSDAYHPDATLRGIDVSHHQGEIDWNKVKADGIDFAIIRCGYGMDMTEQDDRYFEYNASECERVGIPYGVYIYSYADTTERASSEADHVLRLIQGHTLSYPVYFDMEDDSVTYVGNDTLAEIATTFCDKINAAGYPVGVYASVNWWKNYLTDPVFNNWYRWVAHYNDSCGYQGGYAMWQYSCTGSVDGISENVDLNYLIGQPSDHGVSADITFTTDQLQYDFLDSIYVSTNYREEGAWVGMYKQGEFLYSTEKEPIFRYTISKESNPVDIRSTHDKSSREEEFAVGNYTIVLFQNSGYSPLKTVTIRITKKAVSQARIEPTCVKEGSVLTTFTDNSTETEILPKLPHTEVTIPGQDATCTASGLTDGTRCSVCEEILVAQTEIAPLGHAWDEGEVTKEPTAQESGLCFYTCEACGKTKTESFTGIHRIRLAGSGRCETAIEVADMMKKALNVAQFETIILASGENFADALAGSYLAAERTAPILLYRGSAVALNQAYIQENLVKGGTVYLLGGTSAIPSDVEDGLKSAGIQVKRLFGNTRYDTNLEILKEVGIPANQEILITTGTSFADSLSASATGLPILMVNNKTGQLSNEQIAFLSSLKNCSFTIIGGTSAVSEALEQELTQYGTVKRLSGTNREATSVLVAETYFQNPGRVVLAYSKNFPDGLCGGPLAYVLNAPMILTKSGQESIAADYIAENPLVAGYILGGTAALSNETVENIFSE